MHIDKCYSYDEYAHFGVSFLKKWLFFYVFHS